MVVGVALFIANGKPCANPAEFYRLGIGIAGRWTRPQKIISNLPKIGNVASNCERFYFAIVQNHVHAFWRDALDFVQNVGIEAELERRIDPGGPCEFRFHHL